MQTLRHPFGELCCEHELEILQDQYSNFFFYEAPFNEEALSLDTYLIIGRRGSGKTSLTQYFTFQKSIKNSTNIEVDEPDMYAQVLSKISETASTDTDIAITRIVRIWEFVIWSLIFNALRHEDPIIEAACMFTPSQTGPSQIIKKVFRALLKKYLKDDKQELTDELEAFLSDNTIKAAKDVVIRITEKKPIIISFDSLEKYSVDNISMMRATAALVQCASNFNITHARNGIYLKAFLSAEVFPHLCENEISNTIKFVREPVYLLWRPKDLVRLAAYRFFKFLENKNLLLQESKDNIDWANFSDVLKSMWLPYFGEEVENAIGLNEKTFPYILRHTQMRPRQLIMLLNEISSIAKTRKAFPRFTRGAIVGGIKKAERKLATEVINSYTGVYPKVGKILDALNRTPMMFKGKLLDKLAPETASEWPKGDYSPTRFRQLVAELGIVGVVRKYDEHTGIVEADFEYAIEDRLPIPTNEDCVIHPMFYEKLATKTDDKIVVYPFPDHPDYEDLTI